MYAMLFYSNVPNLAMPIIKIYTKGSLILKCRLPDHPRLSLGRSRSRSNQAQTTIGGNTLDTLRILVSRVASIAGGRRSRSDKAQSTLGRNTLGAVRV